MKPHPLTYAWIICVIGALFSQGCQLFNEKTPVLTPERVQAVASVAGYYGGKAAITKGYRPELEQGKAALQALYDSQTPDISAVVAALDAAKVTLPGNDEGQFLIGVGAIFFQDLWAPSGQIALQDAHVRSFIKGLLQGVTLALDAPLARDFGADPLGGALEAIAKKTR